VTPADHANTIRSAPRQLDSSTAVWVRLCNKTVALAAAWAEFKLALDDHGLVCHGDDGGIAEGPTAPTEAQERFVPEGDQQCGAFHREARATCMKRMGHDGPHATPQGHWIDGPWCDYPAAREEALTAGDQGEQSDGTVRVTPADGCAERQSPALPSPAASDDPAYERLSNLVGRTLVRVEMTPLGVMFRFSGGYVYWAAGNLARGGAR
jgi:hypothetical protein